jgi:plastocyanin
MKQYGIVLAFLALMSVPLVAAAQYGPGGGGSQGGSIHMGGGGNAGGGDSGGSGDVTIVDFAYQPSATFVSPGDTVTWTNTGQADHTVDADAGAFESSTINSGGTFSHTFESGRIYLYHCDFHPNMHGIVVVSGE